MGARTVFVVLTVTAQQHVGTTNVDQRSVRPNLCLLPTFRPTPWPTLAPVLAQEDVTLSPFPYARASSNDRTKTHASS
jgi:hypothetical protein